MQPARRRSDLLGHRGGEGNHVVLRGLLDFFDAGDLERGAGAQFLRRVGGHQSRLRHRIRRCQFYREPGLIAALLAPDRAISGLV